MQLIPLRVLIVDDEPLGCQRIVDLLAEHPELELLGSVQDGLSAIEAIQALQPDLVFLDMQMPKATGLDVISRIGPAQMPATIFVTASENFAVEAFQVAAIDYLLKPFSDERFYEALDRANRRIRLEGVDRLQNEMRQLLSFCDRPASRPTLTPKYLERIAVNTRGRLRVIAVESIDYITASGVYAEVHAGAEKYLIRESIQVLEEQLDPSQFFRIHRSEIVRLARVETLVRIGGGDSEVELKNGVTLRVGRSRRPEIERRLGRL